MRVIKYEVTVALADVLLNGNDDSHDEQVIEDLVGEVLEDVSLKWLNEQFNVCGGDVLVEARIASDSALESEVSNDHQ